MGDNLASALETSPVEIMKVGLGDPPGHRARIGLLALSSGMVCEEEMHTMLPPGTQVLTSRIANQNQVNLTTLADMEGDMVRTAATLLPEGHLDWCTGVLMHFWHDRDG